MLRVCVLGPPAVTRDGQAVGFDTRKAVALLAVLAVEDAPQPRDRLAALLWPGADAVRARSALRRTLSVAVAATGEAITVERTLVGLDARHATSDVAEFRRLAAAGDTASLRSAATVYRDDFLAGFTLRDAPQFDDWQVEVADALRRRLAAVLQTLVDADIRAHDLDTALSDAHRWLALDPLHEPAHHALIRIHAWRGDRSAAMRQYRTCLRALDTELGVEPLPETTSLYDAVRRNELPPPTAPVAEPAAAAVSAGRPPMAMVGRDQEVTLLRQALARADDGHGVVATVTGATGAGKTTLLRVAESLRPPPTQIVAARCHPEEVALAYSVAIELCRGVVAATPAAAARLPRHVRAELARLLPELADLDAPPADGDDPAAVARLYSAARDLVASTETPLTLVVDDAQWLDSASAELLAFLVRRIATTRLVLLLAWASDGPGAPTTLARAAADAVAEGQGVALTLRPLLADDVVVLAAQSGVDVDVPRLLADTGGLPSLVTAYLDAQCRGADPAASTTELLRDAVRRRVDDISQTAQQILAAAAVANGRVDGALIREISGRGEAETVSGVEEALRAGLLVELPGGEGYEFPYEALRHVVLDGTTAARRRLLHQRAAAALSRQAGSRPTPADAGAVARHLHAAGNDAEAAEWHWRATVEAQALHAHEQALVEVRSALTLGLAPAVGRLAEGETLIALGRYREAIDALERAAAAADGAPQGTDATTSAVRIERRLADVHHRLGDHTVADAHLAAALERAGDGGVAPGEVAMMLAERALLAYRRDAVADANAFAAEALAVAGSDSDVAAAAYVHNVLGMVAAREDDLDTAERLLRESVEEAARVDDVHASIAALNNLARVLTQAGRHEEALHTAEQALWLGEQVGDRHRVAALHTNLADLLRATGQHDRSMEHLKQAAAMFADVDDPAERRPEVWTLVEW